MVRILIAEDDEGTRRLMEDVISDAGYETIVAQDGAQALELFEHWHVDLALVDVMMPKIDGYTLTQQLREANYNLPILMVTAKVAQQDKRHGLRLGADDYMTKPVDEEEMLLRIAALLRRAKITAERKLVVGETELYYDAMTAQYRGQTMEMPPKEFYLLYKLLSYNNQIFTRQQLLEEIWGPDSESDGHTVNVHINRLRDRFRDNPDFKIVTVYGLGYKAVKRC